MQLYSIQCRFKIDKDSEYVHGLAICTDPDSPMTFIFPDGKPYNSDEIWDYALKHHYPWIEHNYVEPVLTTKTEA